MVESLKGFILLFCFYLQEDVIIGEIVGDIEIVMLVGEDVIQLEVKIIKWCVENFWGEEKDKLGYLMMMDSWFIEFVYEVVVDKKYVFVDVMVVLEQELKVLLVWDFMGLLVCILCEKGDY